MSWPDPAATAPPVVPGPPRVVIAGFGLPGRALADLLESRDLPYSVIEANPEVVARNQTLGRQFVCGDAREEAVLRSAGVAGAEWMAVMIPSDPVMLDVLRAARAIKPTLRVFARAVFTSAGMEATRLGAEEVVVAEQVVAREAAVILGTVLRKG